MDDRRGNDCRAPRPGVAPQDRPIAGGNTGQGFLRELDELPLAVEFGRHHRGVLRSICPIAAAPNDFAGFFVERSQRAAFAARRADHMAAVHQHRLSVAPTGHFPSKILHQFHPPVHLAIPGIGAYQAALCPQRINLVAVHRRGAARPVPPVVAEDAAQRSRPERLSILGLLGEQLLLAALGSHDEQPALGHHRRRVADANVAAQPNAFRPGAWPGLEQAGLTADAVTVGPPPLRPIGGH